MVYPIEPPTRNTLSELNSFVILDVVVVNLRADKDVVPNVVADAAAEIFHEVITAAVVDAPAEVTAGGYLRDVEASAGNADAAEEVGADFLW